VRPLTGVAGGPAGGPAGGESHTIVPPRALDLTPPG